MIESNTLDQRHKQARGRERQRQILDIAEQLLIEGGSAALSMRSVADRAQMSLGNLQYYFKTRDDLIEAVVEEMSRSYEERIKEIVLSALTAEEQLFKLAEFMVEDFRTPAGSTLFWELWALSAHNAAAAEAVNRFHDMERKTIRGLVTALSPHLTKAEAGHRATMIASLFEGIGIFIGEGRSQEKSHRTIANNLKASALALATM